MKRQRLTLAAFARGWLLEMERHDASISKRTRALYARSFRLHVLPILGKHRLDRLRRQDVRAALVTMLDRGVGRGAAWNAYIALASCLSQAVALEIIESNPANRATKKLFLRRPSNVKALTRPSSPASSPQRSSPSPRARLRSDARAHWNPHQ